MNKYIFPVAAMAFNVGAAIVYLFNNDYVAASYWIAAAAMNCYVTF